MLKPAFKLPTFLSTAFRLAQTYGIFLVPVLLTAYFYLLNKFRDGNLGAFGSFKRHLLISGLVFGCIGLIGFLLKLSSIQLYDTNHKKLRVFSVGAFAVTFLFSVRLLYRDPLLGGLSEGFWVGLSFSIVGFALCFAPKRFFPVGFASIFAGVATLGFAARLFSIHHFKFAEQSDILFKIRNAIVYWMYIDGKPYDLREMFQNPERIYHAMPDILPGTWLAYVPSNWMAFDYRYWSLVMATGMFLMAAYFAKEWFDKDKAISPKHWLLLALITPYWLNPYLATRMDHDQIWLAFAMSFFLFAIYIQKWFWVYLAAVMLIMSSYLSWALIPMALAYCIYKKGAWKSLTVFVLAFGTAFYFLREFFFIDPSKFMEATWEKYLSFTGLTYSWAINTMMNFNFSTLFYRAAKQEYLFAVQATLLGLGFLGFFITKSYRSLHTTAIWAMGTVLLINFFSPLVWSYMLILIVPMLIFSFADTAALAPRESGSRIAAVGLGVSTLAIVVATVLVIKATNPHGDKRPDSRNGILDLGYAGGKVSLERVGSEPLICNEQQLVTVKLRLVNSSKFHLPKQTKYPLVLESQPLNSQMKNLKVPIHQDIAAHSSIEFEANLSCENPGQEQKYSTRIVQPAIAEGHNHTFQSYQF